MTISLQPKERIGVHGFVINKQGEILIIKKSETDPDEPNTWDTPGGGIDENTVEEGFMREAFEEIGLEVSNIKLLGAYTIDDPNLQLLVRAETNNAKITLSHEHNEYRWIKLEELENIQPKGLHLRAAFHIVKTGNILAKYGGY